MMDSVLQTGTPLLDPPVPMPSPLRILAYAALISVLVTAVYFCVQAAVMIYDLYTILQWLGGFTE